MEILEFKLNLEKPEKIDIFFLGDIHEGNANHAETEFKEAVKYIKENQNKTYVIGMGDYIDGINHKDPRFDPVEICRKYKLRDLKNLPVKQVENLLAALNPIQDKFIGLIAGNHEEKYVKHNSFDPVWLMSQKMTSKPKILGYNGWVKFGFFYENDRRRSNFNIDIALSHGIGGGGFREGYPVNLIHDIFRFIDADVHIMGHIHQMIVDVTSERITVLKNKIKRRKVLYGSNGCFMRKEKIGTRGYFEGKKGKPSSIGMLKLTLDLGWKKTKTKCFLTPIVF